jgi:ribosomal subunit interface protein
LFVLFDHIALIYLFVANLWRTHNLAVAHFAQGNSMTLQIQAQGFILTDGLRQHVVSRLAYAMNHGRDVVTRVVVRLSDVNGPRGGMDKCCAIEARLKGTRALIVEDTQTDLYVAIDRAAERIGRTLDRRLARRCEFPVISVARLPLPAEETR